jgi:hypothetical protein
VTVTFKQIGEIIFVICAESRVQLSNLILYSDETALLLALHCFYGNYAEARGGRLAHAAAMEYCPQDSRRSQKSPTIPSEESSESCSVRTEVTTGRAFGKRSLIWDK